MLRNYFTLYHVAGELQERLVGGYLFEIYSQSRNEITLSFVTPEGEHFQICVTVRSPLFSLSTREGLNRKRRNTAAIMTGIYEELVTGIAMAPRDRDLLISLESGSMLVLRFYSADTNVLLVRDGHFTDAFKDARKIAGKPFDAGLDREPFFRELERLAMDEQLFLERIGTADHDLPLVKRLARALPGFDNALARDLVSRSEEENIPTLWPAFRKLFYELTSPSPKVIVAPGKPPLFSMLERDPGDGTLCFDEVIEALNQYTRKMQGFLHRHESMIAITNHLAGCISKAEKELARLQPEASAEAAKTHETFGHLLTAAIGTIEPEGKNVTVPDIFHPDATPVTIPVKRGLNLQQNAALHFERASRERKKIGAMEKRRAGLLAELDTLKAKLDTLEQADPDQPLPQTPAGKSPGKQQPSSRKKEEPAARFRTIPITENITLLVGRDAHNNELLTFDHARPDDVWLHARGASGSHCILKGAGLHNLSEIRIAAEIAAWYSAARNSKLVPVIYTLRKYVRKVRNSPGTVTVEREKVLMVKPRRG